MRRCIMMVAITALPCAALALVKPPEISTSIYASAPVGAAEMNKLFFHVYDASFWSDHGAAMKAPYALSITYDMDFSKDELIDRTVKELKHVSTFTDDELEYYAARLGAIWPNIAKGDRITAFTPDTKETVFYYNGKREGQINDDTFTAAFFGIWLSEKTSEPQMRKELIGQ